MSQFRLNAKKPKNNAGLPTPKTELYLLYVEDIISMPEVDAKGILSTSDIVIAPSRRFHILYQTPSSQVHSREIEGDADSRGFKKKLTESFPGNDLEINEFIKNNLNQGFVILVKSCHSDLKKIYGSKCNPLYFTGSFTDDNEHKGYELTFEQEFADDTPVIFYKGNVLVDEDALGSSNVEFSSLFVKLDGSNITNENKEVLKEALGVGEVPDNMATIDKDGEQGNAYTKEQVDDLLENSGKNLGNTDLKIPENTVRVLDTTNAKFQIKGLENKKGDASYNLRVKTNAMGELVVTDDADINIYIPEEHTVQGVGIGNATITVNHIYPNPIPDPATIPNGIQEFMGQIKNLKFKPFTAEDWTINNLEDGETTPLSVFKNGNVLLKNNAGNNTRETVFTNAISRVFPHNKQWAVKLNVSSVIPPQSSASIGLCQTDNTNALSSSYISSMTFSRGWYAASALFQGIGISNNTVYSVLITHSNNVIYMAVVDVNGKVDTSVIGNFDENGNYRVMASLNSIKTKEYIAMNVSGEYWIEE